MKKNYYFIIMFCLIQNILFAQTIGFTPASTHYYAPYNATVYGQGTLYYTTDGSAPTLSSTSATNNFSVYIDQNKTIKVFLVNNQGNTSAIESKKYYVGALPTSKIFFKPPQSWTSPCVSIDMINPNSVNGGVIDGYLNLAPTTCEGWYTLNSYYENANLVFSNCPITVINTNTIPAGSIIYYDFSNGPISNPPSCLFLSTNENESIKTSTVKIYPNPVDDVLNINTSIVFEKYIIYDSNGKIIKEDSLKKNSINIQYLATGNYIMKLIVV